MVLARVDHIGRWRTLEGSSDALVESGPLDSPGGERNGQPASDVEGVDRSGAMIHLALSGPRGDGAVLLFLTSTCTTCRPIWASSKAAAGLVVVTPDPSTESLRALSRLTPAGVSVVMSSSAWFDYEVPGAPWLVSVEAGRIASDGPSPRGWEDVAALLDAPTA